MPLETATYIHDLVAANPAHSDAVSVGDSHVRLIKAVLQNQFPNFTSAACNSTNANIDAAVSACVTGPLTIAVGTVGAPSLSLKADTTTGWYSVGAGKLDVAVSGVQMAEWSSTGLALLAGGLSITSGNITVTSGSLTLSSGNLTVTGNITLNTGTLAVPANGLTIGGQAPNFVPTGATMVWWTDTLPSGGYLWANGAAVSRTTYSALFALLSTNFGSGDGSTTFNLPDLREVAPMGKSTMGGTSSPGRITNYVLTTLGGFVGACLHLLTTGEMPSHTHTATVTDPQHSHPTLGPGGGDGYYSGSGHGSGGTTSPASTGITVSNASQGGGGSHDNVSPGAVCNWVIKT